VKGRDRGSAAGHLGAGHLLAEVGAGGVRVSPERGGPGAARQLGDKGSLLTYRGWGRGTYTSSPCAQRQIDDYLISRTVPPRGSSCPAVEPPAPKG
jgi:hypothetical protein